MFTKEDVAPTRPEVSLVTTTPSSAPGGLSDAAEASPVAAVESLLTRYRAAFAALDVGAVEAVWPNVNPSELGAAFDQLQVQKLDFDACKIDVGGAKATAECWGTARFVPKVGSNSIRAESRHWTFYLVRANSSWIVERFESR
jgi:hypothetical protein